MSKQYSNGIRLYDRMLQGVNTLADNVASTYGPRGRNVIIKEKNKRPIITKDGVTVAKFVNLEDPFENVAAEIVKQASEKTNIESGDGTTTSTILAREIFSKSVEVIDKGISPVEIKRGLDKLTEALCVRITEDSRPVKTLDDITYVAKISSNNDQVIADLISTAISSVGKGGSITIEEARSSETSLDLVEGFRFHSGYASNYFVNDERRGVCRYENPLVFISDSQVDSINQILPCLEIAARESKPLVVISDSIEGQALAALIMNTARGSMKVAAVKAPRYGSERTDIVSDLALSTGAKYFRTMLGDDISKVTLNDLGTASSIEISKYNTIVVGGAGDIDLVKERIDDLEQQIKDTDKIEEAKFLAERKSKLASGVAIIRVGAPTEIEMVEKKHRIEDALEAVRSAQQEGIVAGGGSTLYSLSLDLDTIVAQAELSKEQSESVVIMQSALQAPLKQICSNADVKFEDVAKYINLDNGLGFNFLKCERADMFEEGIVDPAKVVKSAVRNAVSAAGTLLTTNYAIIEQSEN